MTPTPLAAFLYAVKHCIVCLALDSVFHVVLLSASGCTSNLHCCNYINKTRTWFGKAKAPTLPPRTSKLSSRGSKLPSGRMGAGVLLGSIGYFVMQQLFVLLCGGSFLCHLEKQSKILSMMTMPQSKLSATCSSASNYFGHRKVLKLAILKPEKLHLLVFKTLN